MDKHILLGKSENGIFFLCYQFQGGGHLPTPKPPRRKHHSVAVMGPYPPRIADVQVQVMEDALVQGTRLEDKDVEADPQIPRQDHSPSQGGHSRAVTQVLHQNDGWVETRDTQGSLLKTF